MAPLLTFPLPTSRGGMQSSGEVQRFHTPLPGAFCGGNYSRRRAGTRAPATTKVIFLAEESMNHCTRQAWLRRSRSARRCLLKLSDLSGLTLGHDLSQPLTPKLLQHPAAIPPPALRELSLPLTGNRRVWRGRMRALNKRKGRGNVFCTSHSSAFHPAPEMCHSE